MLDWAYIDEFVSSDDDNVRMMRSLANHVDYIDNYSLLKHVDKTQLMFNTSGLMFFKKENSDDQMWSWFNLRKNVTNPLNLGFHDYELYNTDIPKGFYKDVYDQHPNQAGHKRIAETINNYYKEIYE